MTDEVVATGRVDVRTVRATRAAIIATVASMA